MFIAMQLNKKIFKKIVSIKRNTFFEKISKPKTTASEASHRLALIEGQKENKKINIFNKIGGKIK